MSAASCRRSSAARLVGGERRADLPVDLLDCGERVGGAEYFGAVLGERDVDRGGVLAVDGGEAVGMKTPPQPIVRRLQPLLGFVEPSASRAS